MIGERMRALHECFAAVDPLGPPMRTFQLSLPRTHVNRQDATPGARARRCPRAASLSRVLQNLGDPSKKATESGRRRGSSKQQRAVTQCVPFRFRRGKERLAYLTHYCLFTPVAFSLSA